jgi:hypothetical protein
LIPAPKAIIITNITNSKTQVLVAKAVGDCNRRNETVNSRDASDEIFRSMSSQREWQFAPDTDEFHALLGSPSCQAVAYFLFQHKKKFGVKEVTAIQLVGTQVGVDGMMGHLALYMVLKIEDVIKPL